MAMRGSALSGTSEDAGNKSNSKAPEECSKFKERCNAWALGFKIHKVDAGN